MIIDNFKSFPPGGKIMGIDWGAKRIGVAVSDPDRKFVFIRQCLFNKPPRPQSGHPSTGGELLKVIADEGVVGIVLGLPLRLDGTDSPTTVRVREFARELAGVVDVPIILFDESLTSFEAEESGAKNLDSESARVLLENAIAVINRKSI